MRASFYLTASAVVGLIIFAVTGGRQFRLLRVTFRRFVRLHNREITRVRRQLNPSNVQFVSVNPSEMAGKTITAVMSIRETASRTQRIERLDKWNPIARAALQIDGPVGSYFQITLADTGAEPRNTYVAIIQRDLIDELGLQRNSLVGATVEARNSGELAEWFVTEIVAMEV